MRVRTSSAPRSRRSRALLTLGFLAASLHIAAQNAPTLKTPPAATQAQRAKDYGKLPLSFEANHGQSDKSVKFLSRGQGYSLFLTDSAAVLSLSKTHSPTKTCHPEQSEGSAVPSRSVIPNHCDTAQSKTDTIRMELAGASKSTAVVGTDPLPGKANYFLGNDPAKWHSNIPTFSRVEYKQVYDGIDLVYYGNQRQLEYDFVVAPGANPKSIRLHFAGAEKLSLSPGGDLKVVAGNGEIAMKKPIVYQNNKGVRQHIDGNFKLLASNCVEFQIGRYDRSHPLVVDPILTYATYLGGTLYDYASAIAVDASGDAYVTGTATSTDFPVTAGAFQVENGNSKNSKSNAFISKLNSTGSGLVYSTYLGGTSSVQGDVATALALDNSGDAYIAGIAWSSDFPVTKGAFQDQKHAPSSEPSVFVTKLNSTGSALLYSTFLGGNGGDYSEAENGQNYYGDGATSLAVDSTGNVYIAGYASSPDFPVTSGALQAKNKAAAKKTFNAFVTKLNQDGSAEIYSTYLGGSGSGYPSGDLVSGLALDSSGNAYLTGFASSADFPVTEGAFQNTNLGAPSSTNAFVSKLNNNGSALEFSTFLGGCCGTQANAIAVDDSGNSVVTGQTTFGDFPTTAGAFQTKYNIQGDYTGFVTKLNQTGTSEIYSTYLGGTYEDSGNSIAMDSSGNAYIVGVAGSSDFPVTKDAFQPKNKGTAGSDMGVNAFVTELNASGSALTYSTYLGGGCYYCSVGDYATSVALDNSGSIYVAGYAESLNFPVTGGAFQTVHNQDTTGIPNAFIAKFSVGSTPSTVSTPVFNPPTGTYTAAQSVTITDSTTGAVIYYTTDGTTPTTASTKYTAAISVAKTETIKAIATATGYTNSAVASATYTISSPTGTATPVFSPVAGTYTAAQTVTITDATAGATIHYTTNGSTPVSSSPTYTAPISVSASETISAIAISSTGVKSAVATAAYVIAKPVAPVFSPAAGSYTSAQSVTITDTTPGTTIHYTTDGSTPVSSSTKYTGPITVSASETINAIAINASGVKSPVATAVYVIAKPVAPVFKPAAGTYTATQTVTITETTPGTTIHYTTNGSTPTSSSTKYTGPITVSASETINAIAINASGIKSPVATAAYVIAKPVAPVFKPAAGTYTATQTVTITEAIAGTTIHYTTNGSTPVSSSPTYTGPIAVSASETINAIAINASGIKSPVATAAYVIKP